MNTLTHLLEAWHKGQDAALERVFELTYARLKEIATQRLRSQDGKVALSPTELMHEAVVRALGTSPQWQNRAHFFASMSLCMRTALIDHARTWQSERRGHTRLHVTLGQADVGAESAIADLLALDEALNRLEIHDARSSSVLHLSYFAGLDRHEIAEVLKVSVQIVDRELRFAKSWLNAHLGSSL